MGIKFSAFIATSLDGFIARSNDKLDWLDKAASESKQEDYGYQKFISVIDCIVMGRRTFEKVASFAEWPYANKRVIVLSRTLRQVPKNFDDKVSLFNADVELLAVELQNYGFKQIYVDGGLTIQSFIRHELLDEMIITQIPILLGKGIPLFAEVSKDVRLKLLNSQHYPTGFVQSKYQFERYSSKYFD